MPQLGRKLGYNLLCQRGKRGREAVSTDPSIETVLVCLFFRLALKINARGGRETEKLIIVP